MPANASAVIMVPNDMPKVTNTKIRMQNEQIRLRQGSTSASSNSLDGRDVLSMSTSCSDAVLSDVMTV